MNTNSKILKSLASGEKTRSQLAHELELPPPLVAGLLVSMLASGVISISGKTRAKGKDVAVYAIGDQPVMPQGLYVEPVRRETSPVPLRPLRDEAVDQLLNSNLYQLWGGYIPLDATGLKGLAVRRYSED